MEHTLLDKVVALATELGELKAREKSPSPGYGALDVIDLMRALAGESKIESIKKLRSITGMGLKESKDLVEAVLCRTYVATGY